MTKHYFVAGVTMLGFAMLAGAHASANVRIDGPPSVTTIMPGVFVPGKGFTLARRGADDAPNHDANDDGHRQRRGGRTNAADAAPVVPFDVARRGADDPAGHDANEANDTDQRGNHRQRRRGRDSANTAA
jgi:hypothetical protein